MPLRRCVTRRRLDKSSRIGIETWYAFHCATVSSFSERTVVSIALYWSVARKLSHRSFFMRKIETAFPKIFDDDTAAQRNI